MVIKAGEITIDTGDKGIYGEKIYHEGMARPALRIDLPGEITQEQIDALKENDWRIFENNSEEASSVQVGFTYLHQHQITFMKMCQPEVVISELERELAEARALAEALMAEKQEAITAMETAMQELIAVRAVLPIETKTITDTKKGV